MQGPPYVLPAPESGAKQNPNGAPATTPPLAQPRTPAGAAPGQGRGQPVVAPITNSMQPTRLPAVVNAGPAVGPGGQAMRAATTAPTSQGNMSAAPRPNAVQPAAFAANQPQNVPSTRRPVVTGKFAAGSVIPGGASQYLPRPPEANQNQNGKSNR